nr:MAG TPA: Protein of unknown function (DUF1492) [Caudoviricetes sp.]
MKDIGHLMREKREAWELALERYQRLLALEATGNIKSPPMSGMPSGGVDGDKTYELLDEIERVWQRAVSLRKDYMLARHVLIARLRREFEDPRDFKIIWQYVIEGESVQNVSRWNGTTPNNVYKLKSKYKKVLEAEKYL